MIPDCSDREMRFTHGAVCSRAGLISALKRSSQRAHIPVERGHGGVETPRKEGNYDDFCLPEKPHYPGMRDGCLFMSTAVLS